MTSDVEAEQFFLEGQFLALRPLRILAISAGDGRMREISEKRNLAGGAIPMRRGRGGECFLDTGEKLGAIATEKIEGAGFDETLNDLAVSEARIEPAAKI